MKLSLRSKLLAAGMSCLCVLLTSSLYGQWAYMQTIDLQETQNVNQYKKQILLTLNTKCLVDWGMMEPDGKDIRFSYDVSMVDSIPYYIMSGINTPSTKILLSIDSLLASEIKTIYFHYGNPSATAVSNLDFLPGPMSAIDSMSVPSTNTSPGGGWTRGFKFTCNHDMIVPQIGSNTPTNGQFYASIWTGSGTLLTQQIINPLTGLVYLYEDIPNPVILQNGSQYVLSLHSVTNQQYRYGAPGTASVHLTYLNMQYANGTTPSTFPTTTLANLHYGLVDFLYYLVDTNMKASVNLNPITYPETGQVCIGGSYTFPDSTVMNNITSTVTYVSHVVTAGGCDSAIETTVNVIPVNTTVSQNGNTLSSNASLASYQWVNCNDNFLAISGETNKTFTPTANGSYAVVVVQNSCADTSICFDITSIGVKENQLAGQIEIFPNPATDKVRINVNKTYDRLELEITNALGQVVLEQTISRRSAVELDVTDLEAGIYLLKLRTTEETATLKLQVE